MTTPAAACYARRMTRSPAPAWRASLVAAGLMALCQTSLGTLALVARFRDFVLAPSELSQALPHDAAIKLFSLLFGHAGWLGAAGLDAFLGPGLSEKLIIARAALLPNLVLGLLLAAATSSWSWLRRLPLSATGAVARQAVCVLLIHLALWLSSGDFAGELDLPRLGQRLSLDSPGMSEIVAALMATAVTTGSALLLTLTRTWSTAVVAALLAGLTLVMAAHPIPPMTASPAVPRVDAARLSPVSDNVVLISIDSLRADRLSAYGHARPTSPTMDQLARQGVRFAEAWTTAPWTLPAHMSMLTGLYPFSHRVNTESDRLPPAVTTLAERLAATGMRRAGFVSEGLVGSSYGFARGFDTFDDTTAVRAFAEVDEETAPIILRQAEDWLRRHGDQRFFLFLHFWDVHYDYVPPAPYDRMFDPDYRGPIDGRNFMFDDAIAPGMKQADLDHLLARYDGEIRWVDDHLARLLAALVAAGLDGRTAIIVTADHGEEFFEHGYKGHGAALYRPVMQIPLIIRAPGIPPGRVVDEPVSLVDLVPTILELTGVPLDEPLDGISLVPAMAGRARLPERVLHGQRCSDRLSGCRVMRHAPDDILLHRFAPPTIEQFAADDPRQSTNLAATGSWPRRELSALARELNRQRARLVSSNIATQRLSPAAEERLRTLGYRP